MRRFWREAKLYGASAVFTKFRGHYEFEKRRDRAIKKLKPAPERRPVDLTPIVVPPPKP